MSFLRDGDDLNLLNRLKHQRVSELLGTHIPEDEAKLLSNGRLTCLICHSRPIFDTVAVLAKHRKGKKHLLELSRYIKRKQELELELLKKQQQKELSAVTFQSLITSSRHLGPKDQVHDFPFSGKICDSGRRKTLELPTLPYQISPSLSFSESPSISNASQVRKYLKTLHRKRSLDSVIDHMKDNYGNIAGQSSEKNLTSEEQDIPKAVMAPLKENVNKTPPQTSYPGLNQGLDNDFNRNLSGWIKDRHGNWVKDENAEFDSEEETSSMNAQ